MTDLSEPGTFRTALRAWLDENDLTPPPGDESLDAHQTQHLRVLEALYDAGWMRYGWPESAGGGGGAGKPRAAGGGGRVGRGGRGDRRPRNQPSGSVLDARGTHPDDDRLRATGIGRGDGAEAAVGSGI